MPYRGLKAFELVGANEACGAHRQISEPHRSNRNPFQVAAMQADSGKHASNLAVHSFCYGEFNGAGVVALLAHAHARAHCAPLGEMDAAFQFADLRLGDNPVDFGYIRFFDTVARMR